VEHPIEVLHRDPSTIPTSVEALMSMTLGRPMPSMSPLVADCALTMY